MAKGLRSVGDSCWIDILTPAPAGAMGFFERVLGWSYSEMPGLGHGIQVDGRNIGGLFDIDRPDVPPGMLPAIGSMVKVADPDATAGRLSAPGGVANAPFANADRGRMAVGTDPMGPSSTSGSGRGWPGPTTTPLPAAAYDSDLFGWTSEVKPAGGSDSTVFRNGGPDIAGMMSATMPGAGVVPPRQGTYFTAGNVEEAARAAAGLGATLFVPPRNIPGVGRFCGIVSPQGVRFSANRCAA